MRLVSLIAPPLCAACRRPAGTEGVLCRACADTLERLPSAPVPLAGLDVWAPVSYVGPARAIVRGLKFHGATALAGHMAASIAAGAPEGMLRHPLVPVPSPARRRRARGFCHAVLLAEALGERAALPVLQVLGRVGTRRQVGRARSQRLRMPPRFTALRPGMGPVVLVDDVITTGATLSVCARALRKVGCSCEGALAYARTPVR